MTLRSTTNLVIPEDLRLPKEQARMNFMYVYTAAYTGLEPVFMQKLWLSVLFPEISGDPRFGKDRKALRAFATWTEKQNRAGLLQIKKINDPSDPHFEVAVPLIEFNNRFVDERVSQMQRWFLGKQDLDLNETTRAVQESLAKPEADSEEFAVRKIPASQVIPRLGLDAKGVVSLQQCFYGLRIQSVGALTVVFADFKISKEEAQQLTTTPWLRIRNMDMYPLLLQWQVSLWGFRGTAPTTSFPMSKIAKTLPPIEEGQARVNEFGISIAPDGAPVWLPQTLDNTTRYEDLFSQVGDKGDDTFGLIDVATASHALTSGEEIKVHLPANIPVLIDWVNNRYAYTQSNGVLKVQDLSRYKVCDPAHARAILAHTRSTWNIDKELSAWTNMAVTAGVKDSVTMNEEEAQVINSMDPVIASKLAQPGGLEVEEYFGYAIDFHGRFFEEVREDGLNKFTLSDISTQGHPIWRPLARFIEQAQAAILANMDAVNHKYSVHGVSLRLGYLTLMAKYGSDWSTTKAKANLLCHAAAKQEVDPNWKPDSIPLIMKDFGVLPHQAKVMNLMKDSPDFAILPVQAGGGKTPLAILDVLKEIKANRSRPYLIMCPKSLVAQYVKEVTFFTSGKLNVIPIENYTLRRNGFARLTKMLENAPRNSVVVCNYDVLRNQDYDVCYGTTNVKIYPIIEFLRQFNFGYVLCDEAHFLKNDSARSRAAQMLIADIPKKRLASGTMAHDSPSDLALQIALLDPTIFGSRDDFNAMFGQEIRGGRVIKWKPGAQQDIMRAIKSRVVVAKAMRKEWAALLPTAEEIMHPVSMSDAQKTVYDAILMPILEQMREDAKTNPTLRKFFESSPKVTTKVAEDGNKNLNEEEDEQAEKAADEDAGEGLASLLGFYLARLEQFMTAPGKDELGAKMLTGDDLISPKVRMIKEIVKNHIDQKIPGKALIFTNFIESAEEIYEVLCQDPELKATGILYTAANQVEDGAAFEGNANKKWMVGVENSMNTGLNFQFVSRLIRVENVWNPGTLEQGNSRINRPQLKSAEERDKIYYDWIIVDKSIDVTKVSRLISKIVAVSKFENTDNPAYETLQDLEIVPMNAETIQSANDWNANLKEYAETYRDHNTIRKAEYKEYREKHGKVTLTKLTEAPIPKDAMLMAEVPYTAGLELFQAGERGLVRVDAYLRMNQTFDDDEDGKDASAAQKAKKAHAVQQLIGKEVHTEWGDGVATSISYTGGPRVTVALASGYAVQAKMASAFVITDKASRDFAIREQLLKAVHDKMPVQPPVDVIPEKAVLNTRALKKIEQEKLKKGKEKEKLKKQKEVVKEIEAQVNVELEFTLSNGFLGLTYFPEDSEDDASAVLQAMGFRPTEQHVYAEIPSAQHLLKLFNKWEEAGFVFDKDTQKLGVSFAFHDLMRIMKLGNQVKKGVGYRFATKNDLQNFFRMEFKPTNSDKAIKPYPLLENDSAYVVMPLRGQPATKKAMQVKVPGIRWEMAPESMTFYGGDAAHIAQKLRELLGAGIGVSNIEDLRQQFKSLHKQNLSNKPEKK